ncbi:MAG: hypothetical protein LBC75_07635 [Fibromonadaceae bacterium]|nr:hypothetical protein [Fibromonadaceae bacterium]
MIDEHILSEEMIAKYKDIPRLTKEEERHLLENKNDPAAQKKLVDAYMYYILRVVRGHARQQKDAHAPTLVEQGTNAFINAIEHYETRGHGFKFISYAIMWVKQATLKYIYENHYFTDKRDRKMYRTVKIGEQVWMAQNLAYNAKGSKCYDDDENNGIKYGRLYDWDTAMKSCPDGWHLPSMEEWQTLIDFAGGTKVAGKKLRATDDWVYDEEKSTDDFGFAALPGGWADAWASYYLGEGGFWHSSSTFPKADILVYTAMCRFSVFGVMNGVKNAMYSIRCIKNVNEEETFKTAELCLEFVPENLKEEVKNATEAK